MVSSLSVFPIALIFITVGVLDDTVTVFFIVEPFPFIFAACLVMVDSLAMFFSIEEVALVFVFI